MILFRNSQGAAPSRWWRNASVALALLAGGARLLAANETIQVWQTTSDLASALARKPDLTFQAGVGTSGFAVPVDDTKRYQQMDGFGVSMTDAAAYNLTTHLSAAKRTEVMNQLFGTAGIGMNLLRQPMGSCDFNRDLYSYDDTAGDTELKSFSVARDDEVIVPLLKQALAINPALRVIGSPWSAPGWMKTSGSMIGGTLRSDMDAVFAAYFVKYVQAYRERGIPIYAVTPQNEPGYASTKYPGMLLSPQQQIDLIDQLGPQLATLSNPPLLLCYDHNYDTWSTPHAILADATASRYVAGSAFHHYGGTPSQMSLLEAEYPAKGIWFTEGGIGDWNNTFANLAHEMVAIPRNWAKTIVFWNAALDQSDGPALIGPDNTNQGMVTIRNDAQDSVTYNPQFYYMGHLSKFVRPGAWRIDSPSVDGNVETVAFRNGDTIAVLVYNANTAARAVTLSWHNESVTTNLPGQSLTTFVWPLPAHVAFAERTVGARPGQLVGVALAAENDGQADWGPAYKFDAYASWNTGQAYTAPLGYLASSGNALGSAVAGQTARPTFAVRAPVAPGSYTLTVRPYLTTDGAPALGGDGTVTLNVADSPRSRLVNMSVRAVAGTGSKTLIAGFVTAGTGAKQVLVRAVGPTLANFGVPGVLADPQLKLYDATQTLFAANDDWGMDADGTLTAVFNRLYAFPLPPGSKDAVVYGPIPVGLTSAQVATTDGSGVALVEAYDADARDSPSQFVNVSARNQVGTGANSLVIGFVIDGAGPKTLLLRGVGPTLASYAVADALPDPQLTLFDANQRPVAENDDWSSAQDMSSLFDHLYAFQLPVGSKDAGMVVTLDPGLYTAQVTGVGDTTGVGLVEVYDADL